MPSTPASLTKLYPTQWPSMAYYLLNFPEPPKSAQSGTRYSIHRLVGDSWSLNPNRSVEVEPLSSRAFWEVLKSLWVFIKSLSKILNHLRELLKTEKVCPPFFLATCLAMWFHPFTATLPRWYLLLQGSYQSWFYAVWTIRFQNCKPNTLPLFINT